MASLLDFDEIHSLVSFVYRNALQANKTDEEKIAEVQDWFLTLLINTYRQGERYAQDQMGRTEDSDERAMRAIIYQEIEGKTFEGRVRAHMEEGSETRLLNLADDEATRVFNQGSLAAVERIGKETGWQISKCWQTMLDDRVRDTHSYLEGMRVPLESEFYTFDGDHASAPHGFAKAENNCGCRCFLSFDKAQ